MMPGVFNDYNATKLATYTLSSLMQEEGIEPDTIPVEVQHDMVRTHRHKVGTGPEENWVACKYSNHHEIKLTQEDILLRVPI